MLNVCVSAGGFPGGVPGGIPGGVPGGVPIGVPGGISPAKAAKYGTMLEYYSNNLKLCYIMSRENL